MSRLRRRVFLALAPWLVTVACLAGGQAQATERFITLASTTSTEQSGLLAHVIPIFRAATGIDVRVVAVGTGQAFAIARRGDADAVLVHDRAGEDRFVAQGFGIDRRDAMFNDFVLVGPREDQARTREAATIAEALRRIATGGHVFASRGDDSGTHRLELRLWRAAGIPRDATRPNWYRELGSGMGPTLNTAAGLGAYTLTDRATWASFANRRGLTILVQGDPELHNPYGSILVDPTRHPHVKAADARIWHEWLTSPAGVAAITSFRIDGEQLFFPPTTTPRG